MSQQEQEASAAASHDQAHGKVVNPVIFSRQTTLHGPEIDEKMAENDAVDAAAEVEQAKATHKRVPTAVRMLIHQTDKDGNHQRHSHSEETPAPAAAPEPPARPSFWRRLCCFCSAQPEKSASESDAPPPETPRDNSTNSTAATPRTAQPPGRKWLLGDMHHSDAGKKCLVLDLDETLVHSSFQHVSNADYVIPVAMGDAVHNVYVLKRPGVDEFIVEMAKYYELVVYTASLDRYADPLLDQLDVSKKIRWRLFRESCVFHQGHYVKDLSLLDRDLAHTIIIDNSEMSYMFHPKNAIGCTSFIDDPEDFELLEIAEFLKHIHQCEDVRQHCSSWREWCRQHATKRRPKDCYENRQVNF